jgi:aldehyde dehydrogenase (NAD+)
VSSVRTIETRADGSINKSAIAQIVNPQNFARIKSLVDDAVARGATVAVGGMLEEEDRTVHPTLLTDVTGYADSAGRDFRPCDSRAGL